MRIITDNDLCSIDCDCDICQSVRGLGVEISDDELNDIYILYWNERNRLLSRIGERHLSGELTIKRMAEDALNVISFSRYLGELIELKRG